MPPTFAAHKKTYSISLFLKKSLTKSEFLKSNLFEFIVIILVKPFFLRCLSKEDPTKPV